MEAFFALFYFPKFYIEEDLLRKLARGKQELLDLAKTPAPIPKMNLFEIESLFRGSASALFLFGGGISS